MAENEYEEQPEAPDLGASAQLETGESLVGPPGKDALDAGYIPPDRPFALDEKDVTPEGQRERDTLDERLHRERPDVVDEAVVDEADVDEADLEAGAADSIAGDERSGRLTSEETAPDTEPVESLDAEDRGISGGAAAAEEAAVHTLDPDATRW